MMKSIRWFAIAAAVFFAPLVVFAQLPDKVHPLPSTESAGSNLPPEGQFTVSVSSLEAPEKAKRALEKGVQAERKGKWESARDYFKSAIKLYPRYALAWLELGRLQVRQNSLLEASESFHQAVAQDSRLTDGYVELAHVAAQQQNWRELADVSDRLVTLSPDSSPEFWFLNSAAYYNLGNLQQAESSIARAQRLDVRRQIPQIQYLYGLVMGSKKDFKSAAEHIDAYLQLAPNAQDKAVAQNLLSAYQYRAQLAETDQEDTDQ